MAKFCRYCGEPLETGAEKFCPMCGEALAEAQVTPRQEPMHTATAAFTTASIPYAAERKEEHNTAEGSYAEERKEYQSYEEQEKPAGRSYLYIIDFAKTLTRSGNIPVILYLILNVFVIAGIFTYVFQLPFWKAFLTGIVLYLLSVTVALSPLGEYVLRYQTGCHKIKDKRKINRLEPIFREVYAKARRMDPSIPTDVQLFMSEDDSPNAFATGRKTICVTKGLLDLPDEQIKATLSHEFGHLAHKDTDLILVVSVGNFIITAVVFTIRTLIWLMQMMFAICCLFIDGTDGILAGVFNGLTHIMITIFVSSLMWVWTKIGILMVSKASRNNEFLADEFAFDLGYGSALCVLLDSISGPAPKGLFRNLASSHPDTDARIGRLQDLGVRY